MQTAAPGKSRRLAAATLMAMENLKRFLVALCAAAAAGVASIIFVLIWVLLYKEGLAWDGGLAEFNWHPVLIVIGFIFLQGMGKRSLSSSSSFKHNEQTRFTR